LALGLRGTRISAFPRSVFRHKQWALPSDHTIAKNPSFRVCFSALYGWRKVLEKAMIVQNGSSLFSVE
jgi:hypothetical protein